MPRCDVPRTPVHDRQVPLGAVATTEESRTAGVTSSPTVGDVTSSSWAVVEIHADGSWGAFQLVHAPGAPQAVAAARALSATDVQRVRDLSPVLHARVGSLHAAEGRLHLAAAAFARGGRAATTAPGRAECLGRLAHVLALQGDLERADVLASTLPLTAPTATGSAAEHARTARAWVALMRADFAEARRVLGAPDLADPAEAGDDPWLVTSTLVVRSSLLVATGDPEAATRLLAADAEVRHDRGGSGWLDDLLTLARAEALLASGDVKRSLALLTPLPFHSHASASVLAATARLRVGDARGARSVLAQAEEELDREPVAVQVQAWLLAAHLADERGDRQQTDLLVERALRAAASTGTRLPLMRHWTWTRQHVDRSPTLMHAYRDLLTGCHFDGPSVAVARCDPPAPGRDSASQLPAALPAPLTEREEQVLELLAQMFSTEEIAEALYISVNTVKTHLKGIFGKLCVNRRVDAVRRGRQLGLC